MCIRDSGDVNQLGELLAAGPDAPLPVIPEVALKTEDILYRYFGVLSPNNSSSALTEGAYSMMLNAPIRPNGPS